MSNAKSSIVYDPTSSQTSINFDSTNEEISSSETSDTLKKIYLFRNSAGNEVYKVSDVKFESELGSLYRRELVDPYKINIEGLKSVVTLNRKKIDDTLLEEIESAQKLLGLNLKALDTLKTTIDLKSRFYIIKVIKDKSLRFRTSFDKDADYKLVEQKIANNEYVNYTISETDESLEKVVDSIEKDKETAREECSAMSKNIDYFHTEIDNIMVNLVGKLNQKNLIRLETYMFRNIRSPKKNQ